MIITISGKPCCGKSTMAEIFCKKYNFDRLYAGAIFKQKAKEMGLSSLELSSSKKCVEIDYMVDDYLKNVYNERLNDNLLIESRTSFSFMPKAFNVFIDVSNEVMANRLLNSDRTGKEKVENFEEAINNVMSRYKADCDRYAKIYNIYCDDMSNYTFVLDNSNLTPEETADAIYKAYLEFLNNVELQA